MTPLEWAHIRSIAKWVLPVLVGPRIARTMPSEVRGLSEVRGPSEVRGIRAMWQRFAEVQALVDWKPVLNHDEREWHRGDR